MLQPPVSLVAKATGLEPSVPEAEARTTTVTQAETPEVVPEAPKKVTTAETPEVVPEAPKKVTPAETPEVVPEAPKKVKTFYLGAELGKESKLPATALTFDSGTLFRWVGLLFDEDGKPYLPVGKMKVYRTPGVDQHRRPNGALYQTREGESDARVRRLWYIRPEKGAVGTISRAPGKTGTRFVLVEFGKRRRGGDVFGWTEVSGRKSAKVLIRSGTTMLVQFSPGQVIRIVLADGSVHDLSNERGGIRHIAVNDDAAAAARIELRRRLVGTGRVRLPQVSKEEEITRMLFRGAVTVRPAKAKKGTATTAKK